jgi:hypothetical protein
MTTTNSAIVAVFDRHDEADKAIRDLAQAGFDMKKLSIVGKDYHSEEHAVGFYTTGDRMKFWGKLGAFWGGIWGIVFSSALLFIPILGHIIVLGPLVAALVGTLEGAVLGGSGGAFVGALTMLGIPKKSVVKYEEQVKAGKFVLIAQGTEAEISAAETMLKSAKTVELAVHGA